MGRAITCALAASFVTGCFAFSASGQTPSSSADDFKAKLEATIEGAIRNAGSPPFNAFYWNYDFDGTDASLSGLSGQPGRFSNGQRPQIYVAFDCSKQWVRFSIKPSNIGRNADKGIRKIVVNNSIAASFDGTDPVVLVTTAENPDRRTIRFVSELTKAMHDGGGKKIAFEYRTGLIRVSISSASYSQLERKQSITAFRERCSSWWTDF